MKTKTLFALLMLIGIGAKSQTTDLTMYDNSYYFVTLASLKNCDGNGVENDDLPAVDVAPKIRFKIVKILTDSYVIRILPATGTVLTGQTKEEFNKQLVHDESNHDIYLLISKADFANECALSLSGFTVGALTLPIKIRPGEKFSDGSYRDFSFESDISIGLSIGYKFAPNSRYSGSLLGGIDLTSVPITPASTNNTVTSPTNVSAITWHLGMLFQMDNLQLGVFTGIDYLAGATGRQWMYRNDMWLGVGIGYSLFSPKKTTDTQ